jgi:fumarate hydratase class II
MGQATRTESDSFGPIEVPAERLWGAQTERSLRHFRISSERVPRELVLALARVKQAAALVNLELGLLDGDKARAIAAAADEVLEGRHEAEFPLSVWQTGSGTQTHMNVNEVLANRASELLGGPRGAGRLVHPNDDVNRGQSSNDVVPSALNLAAVTALRERVLPALLALRDALRERSRAFAQVVKLGRTHLQDATPLTLGQEIGAWASQLDQARRHVEAALPRLYELAVGGTAVGTGQNTHPRFGALVARRLAEWTGHPFESAPDRFEALACHDGLVFAHGALKTAAAALSKIASDVRLLASGPRAGLGEISIPENEPGSSIMPGKVNPTQSEALLMACAQVLGNDVTVNLAGASGQLQLNAMRPVLAQAFLSSCRLLADGCDSFREHCAAGLEPRRDRIALHLQRSLMLATALTPQLGYDAAARIARAAQAGGLTLREAALQSGLLTAEQFDAWVRPELMTGNEGGR